jgi:hypothetical protein
MQSLPPSHAQKYAAREIKRMGLPLLTRVLGQRAAYEEIGLSGLPPHFADVKRESVAKAVAELNALRDEIIDVVNNSETKAPALMSSGAA